MRSPVTVRRRGPARARGLVVALALAGALLAGPRAAGAQAFQRFDVPDSLLKAAVAASGPDFEASWNALFVAELRAISGTKNALVTEFAAHLLDLERKIARAEPDTLGSRIAADALVLRFRWQPDERDLRITAAVTESLASAFQTQRSWARADSLYRAALTMYRRLAERRREAWVVGSLGVVTYSRGDLPRADSIYREALGLRRALGDLKLIGNTLNALGITNDQMWRFPEAYGYYQEAAQVRQQTGERPALANTLNLLSATYLNLLKPDSARIVNDRAVALAVELGDSVRTADGLVIGARILTQLGDYAGARARFERALAIARSRNDPRIEAGVRRWDADRLRRQGRFGEAAHSLEQAAALTEGLRDPRTLAQDLISLGRIAVNVRDARMGRAPLERALAIADSLRDAPLQALVLNNLAILATLEHDWTAAQRLGTRALARANVTRDSVAVHDAATTLGQMAFEKDGAAAARAWFERAAAAGRGLGDDTRASDANNLGLVAVQTGRLDEAERWFGSALDLGSRAGIPDLVWPALLGLGDAAERRGDYPKALAFDRRAAGLIDTLRAQQGGEAPSIAVLGRRLFAFEALIHLLGKLEPRFPDSGYDAEAFQWAERARARSFLDLLEGAATRSGAAAPAGAAPAADRILTLKQARGLLPSDRDALLEYSLGDSSSSLWIVTRRGARHVVLPPRGTLRARAELLRRGLGDPTGALRHNTQGAARGLYRALIEPVEKDLNGIEHLIVSPDDALAFLPFEALLMHDPTAADEPPGPGSYLVERFTVSYVPSASALAGLRGASRTAVIVALGNPRFGADSTAALAPLPNTVAEVTALGRLAGNRRFLSLIGADATRANLLGMRELLDAGVIHLATHGQADENDPARSGLWLAAAPAAGQPDSTAAPGFLSVDDILGLRLHAELVTLSACETGLGRLERGEGVMGLTRAFLVAGARSVVVSLWRVNDRSTALLMEGFYGAALDRGQALEEALANSKRALLGAAETRSPYYWAPFILAGAGGKIR